MRGEIAQILRPAKTAGTQDDISAAAGKGNERIRNCCESNGLSQPLLLNAANSVGSRTPLPECEPVPRHAPSTVSPYKLNRISLKLLARAHQRHRFIDALGNEDAVKGISMMERKVLQAPHMIKRYGQNGNSIRR